MPNWQRIIVGDAFKLPHKHPRYYSDLVLVFPLIVSVVMVAGIWFDGQKGGARDVVMPLAVAVICIALAKETRIVVGAACAFLTLRGLAALAVAKSKTQFMQIASVTLAGGLIF